MKYPPSVYNTTPTQTYPVKHCLNMTISSSPTNSNTPTEEPSTQYCLPTVGNMKTTYFPSSLFLSPHSSFDQNIFPFRLLFYLSLWFVCFYFLSDCCSPPPPKLNHFTHHVSPSKSNSFIRFFFFLPFSLLSFSFWNPSINSALKLTKPVSSLIILYRSTLFLFCDNY